MNRTSAPRRRAHLFFYPGDGGWVAYDPKTDRIHRFNPLASLIVELCNGRRTISEIQGIIAPLLPEGEDRAVQDCIERGCALGIFTTGSEPPPEVDLEALVRRLRGEGKIEAAYICQWHRAERASKDPQQWALLGEFARILGRRREARTAYEQYLRLRPEDGEIRHLVRALEKAPPPKRASDAAITHLYQRFASFYETNMLEELGYEAPKRLSERIPRWFTARDLVALDLGCGTGLAGAEIRPYCARLVGVDLSSPMLDRARTRGIYDRLDQAEISDWLDRCGDSFDLLLACDSLIYFGDLEPVLRPARPRLTPGGRFLFTLEQGDRHPFALSDNGRYTHTSAYVRQVAQATGWRVLSLETGFLRMEYGQEVIGLIAVLG